MSKLTVKDYQKPTHLPQAEHQILEFWDETDAFNQSVASRPADKPFIFYDGPPFATGLPHYGHILSSTVKDVIPRFWTMKGYRVERVWGWDCHGIPIENIVEQQLGFKGGKRAIEAYGIDKFNQACRAAIWQFDKDWEIVIRRIGRWVDFKNSYKTMDTTYMESVWWAFQQLWQKNLVYQGKRVILYCPRCGTPLSNFEIAMDNSYKSVTDPSTIYKYRLKGRPDTYLLAWSTTPWNKLATPALAVNPSLEYVEVKQGKERYILAKSTLSILNPEPAYQINASYRGKDLEQFEFELHYDFYPQREGKRAGVIIADDYVSAQEGTGVVTLAVYGEEDFRVMQARDVQLVEHVDDQGKLKPEVEPWAGLFFLKANPLVNADLAGRGLIYRDEPYQHDVAVCYRCDTRLYYAPVPAWFIHIQKLKPHLLSENEHIHWYPGHLKHGRFGKGLETAPDWNISRSRYWGTPMPIWIETSPPPGRQPHPPRVIGSIQELRRWAVNPQEVENLTDIHREHIDHIQVWLDDDQTIPGTRIPEVFDCWVESGSMPYASIHYPFENKAKFEAAYPAQFISEYIAQTRAWFYTLHVMSVGVFGKHAFENALTTGTILAEDGSKMSKSKKNFPDPSALIEKFGVDALRFYLMNSVLMKGDNLNFSENQVKDIYQKLINILWHTFSFFKLYAPSVTPPAAPPVAADVLDRWLLSRTATAIQVVTQALDGYDTIGACRHLQTFVTDLSTWYLRRSRDRLRQDTAAQQIFAWAMDRLIHLLAPLTPFITELIYQNLSSSGASIHLNSWPRPQPELVDARLEADMVTVRAVVEGLHSLRQQRQLKVRQPLAAWSVDEATAAVFSNQPELQDLVNQEVNVKNFTPPSLARLESLASHTPGHIPLTVYLDTQLTRELELEGRARDLQRQLQDARKHAGVGLNQPVAAVIPAEYRDLSPELLEQVKQAAAIQTLTFGGSLEVTPA